MSGLNSDRFTPARRAAILESISNRIPYELAAEANGICEDTLYEWLKRGKQDLAAGNDTEYARFSESLKKIEQLKCAQHLEKIASNVDRWQADAWILERRWWQYFSPNAALIEFNKKLNKLEKDSSTSELREELKDVRIK